MRVQVGGRPFRTVYVLALGGLCYSASQSALGPALPHIQVAFHIGQSTASLAFSAFFVASAVMTGIAGRLGDMFGKKRLLLASLGVFAVGSVVSGTAASLNQLIVGRVLMGAAGGIFALAYSIIREQLPPRSLGLALGIVSATFGIGSALGLPIGGWLIDVGGFRALFWASLGVAAIVIALTGWLVTETTIRDPGRIDWLGALLFASGLSLPLVAISQSSRWGWPMPSLAFIGVGALLLAILIPLELRLPRPLIHIPTFIKRQLWTTNLVTGFVAFGQFGAFIGLTQLVQMPVGSHVGFGATAAESGLFLLPAAMLSTAAAPIGGWVARWVDPRTLVLIGATIEGAGIALITTAHTDAELIYFWAGLLGVGSGLVLSGIPVLVTSAVPIHTSGEANGLNSMIRSVGAGLGAQAFGTIVGSGSQSSAAVPTNAVFTLAFGAATVSCALALAVGYLIPRRKHQRPGADEARTI